MEVKRYEYRFMDSAYSSQHGISQPVQWCDTLHRTWELKAYLVIDRLTNKVLKDRFGGLESATFKPDATEKIKKMHDEGVGFRSDDKVLHESDFIDELSKLRDEDDDVDEGHDQDYKGTMQEATRQCIKGTKKHSFEYNKNDAPVSMATGAKMTKNCGEPDWTKYLAGRVQLPPKMTKDDLAEVIYSLIAIMGHVGIDSGVADIRQLMDMEPGEVHDYNLSVVHMHLRSLVKILGVEESAAADAIEEMRQRGWSNGNTTDWPDRG